MVDEILRVVRRAFWTVVGALLLALPVTAVAAASHAHIYVASRDCTGSTLRPSKITIGCPGQEAWVTGVKYSSYGGPTAIATGRLHFKPCPGGSCAGAPVARITLTHVARCRGRRYYEEISYAFHTRTSAGTGTGDITPPACSRNHTVG
jgi:hypothetical protein